MAGHLPGRGFESLPESLSLSFPLFLSLYFFLFPWLWLGLRSDSQVWSMSKIWAFASRFVLANPQICCIVPFTLFGCDSLWLFSVKNHWTSFKSEVQSINCSCPSHQLSLRCLATLWGSTFARSTTVTETKRLVMVIVNNSSYCQESNSVKTTKPRC